MKNDYQYEALDKNGRPYMHKARIIRDLRPSDAIATLEEVAKGLCVKRVFFGVPLYVSLGMRKAEAIKTSDTRLMLKGEELLV